MEKKRALLPTLAMCEMDVGDSLLVARWHIMNLVRPSLVLLEKLSEAVLDRARANIWQEVAIQPALTETPLFFLAAMSLGL